jgi:hypothetical protein
VQQVVAVELAGDAVDQREPGLRAARHRDRHGAVELDDRAGRHPRELAVQGGDLPPVGVLGARRLGVQRGDGRLQRVRARRPLEAQRALDQRERLGDHPGVPARAVLVAHQHEPARRVDPRGAARLDEQHQRHQPGRLGLAGHQREHDLGQPDRLGGEVVAREVLARRRGVALVEHEVEDGEHGGQAVGQRVGAGHPDRDARRADLALGAHEPLGDRRLGHEQAACDLGHREAAHQAQRQRHLRVERQRRVTAGEHQREALVRQRLVLPGQLGHDLLELAGQLGLLVAQHRLAPQPVDRAPAGGGEDPRGGVLGHPVARPAVQRDDVGVLDGLLGAVEVPERAGQHRYGAAELGAEGAVDGVCGAAQATIVAVRATQTTTPATISTAPGPPPVALPERQPGHGGQEAAQGEERAARQQQPSGPLRAAGQERAAGARRLGLAPAEPIGERVGVRRGQGRRTPSRASASSAPADRRRAAAARPGARRRAARGSAGRAVAARSPPARGSARRWARRAHRASAPARRTAAALPQPAVPGPAGERPGVRVDAKPPGALSSRSTTAARRLARGMCSGSRSIAGSWATTPSAPMLTVPWVRRRVSQTRQPSQASRPTPTAPNISRSSGASDSAATVRQISAVATASSPTKTSATMSRRRGGEPSSASDVAESASMPDRHRPKRGGP